MNRACRVARACVAAVALSCAAQDPAGADGAADRGDSGAGSSAEPPGGSGEGEEEAVANQGVGAGRVDAPVLAQGRYIFRAAGLEVEVDPAVGGRITRASLDGGELLTGPDVVAGGTGSIPNMYGSTFWTSPQRAWGWPPEIALDSAPHAAIVERGTLRLQSEPGATTGYAVEKRFSLDGERAIFHAEYTLQNLSASEPAAPWEITRVPKSGLVFFPSRGAPAEQSTLGAEIISGLSWVDVASAPARDAKLFQDGAEGWLAHATGDFVLIKVFEDIEPEAQAPSEAEIEVFVNGDFGYVEIEQQGRYALPPTGGASSWRVDWLLRRRPREVPLTLGDPALAAWVRDQVRAAR